MVAEALLQWLHEGGILAGQLRAVHLEHTAWIGIYPLNADRPDTREALEREGLAILPGADVRAYRIRLFEIPDSLRDAWFGEDDLERTQSVVVLGDDALLKKLQELRIPLEILDSPRRVDYPL
jgi:hypothetical protein